MSTKAQTNPNPESTTEAGTLDYAIDEEVVADSPAAFKALADGTRLAILDLLLERAATTSHLAEALGKPKGTVGYHLKVLEKCGLIHIVRTRQVRAMTEKYYGRVGRTIIMSGPGARKDPLFMVYEALRDVEITEGDPLPMFTTRRARIPESQALEYASRLAALATEFAAEPREGERTYGMLSGVYPTDLPTLTSNEDG
jgi:DNA-binding transcriptional ArsR family regulator